MMYGFLFNINFIPDLRLSKQGNRHIYIRHLKPELILPDSAFIVQISTKNYQIM